MRRRKQIEEYKNMISSAFVNLLQSYSLDQITVTQIVTEAGIGRNTFYNHFKKKEDILDYLMNEFVEELQSELKKKTNPSIRDFLLWRFTLLKTNPLLSALNQQDDVRQVFYSYRNSKLSSFDFPILEESYKMEFFQGGIDNVTSSWIINGMKESSVEMTERILSFMSR